MKKRISLCLAIAVIVSAILSATSYASSEWVWPVTNGKLGCTFNCQCSTHGGKHSGIDINGVPAGTPIKAAHSGTVTCVNNYQSGVVKCPTCGTTGGGYHVEIYCGSNLCTYYAHMSGTANLYIGQSVSAGQVIGYVGNTGASYGAHLHFAMSITGSGGHFTSNMVDPLKYVSPGSSPSASPFSGVWVESITANDAVLWATFNLQYYSECGFYIGKSKDALKKVKETVNANADRAWYNLNKWYGKLDEGTKYYYQMYVVRNGQEFKSSVESFVTSGNPRISTISITALPNRVTYSIGDKIDLTGLKVVANYTNGTSAEASNYTVNEISTDTPGEKSIVVSCGEAHSTFKITVERGFLGDVDGNNEVDISDALLILKAIAGWNVKIVEYRADINRDGQKTIEDVILMLKHIAGWKIQFFDDYNNPPVPVKITEPIYYY